MTQPPNQQQQQMPFNGPVLVYKCQCCGCDARCTPRRAPSGIVQGRTMMEKFVCQDCQADHADKIKCGFWGEAPLVFKPGVCPGCEDKLESGQSFMAHVSPNDDGTWKMGRVCPECWAEYAIICRQNMTAKGG